MSMPNVEQAILSANLSETDLNIAKHIIGRNGALRSSKPKHGEAAYVWRMVAFSISTNPQHHCMPMGADFDIDIKDANGRWDIKAVRNRTKELDVLVNSIVNNVPKSQWNGVIRWGQAFGMI